MPREVYSIICDDIRLEEGNKMSLMGLYTEGIIVPAIPFILPKLCLIQEFEELANIKNILVNLKGPKISIKSELQIEMKERKRLRVRVGFGPIQFETEGDYKFETYFDDAGEPAATKEFYVQLRADLKKS